MNEDNIIGVRIKEVRKHTKLTQEDFAHKIGLSRSTLAQIEVGKANPTFETIFNICSMFDVDPNYFTDRKNVYPNVYLNGTKTPNEHNDLEQAINEHTVKNTDSKHTFRKVKRAFKIGDLYHEFDQVIGLVYEYQEIIGYYDIQTQIERAMRQSNDKLSFNELQNQLVKPVDNFKEVIEIIKKYKAQLEQLHAEIVAFNDQHDKYDGFSY